MLFKDLLLEELDSEFSKTRSMLERVPQLHEFTPHERSMKLGKLATHTGQLAGFGTFILSLPSFDFATAYMKPATYETTDHLLALFDAGVEQTRSALLAMPETSWGDTWKLSSGDRIFFEGTRFLAYRSMFLNHMIHHRAQLGVYLRLNNIPIPGMYGPSADDHHHG